MLYTAAVVMLSVQKSYIGILTGVLKFHLQDLPYNFGASSEHFGAKEEIKELILTPQHQIHTPVLIRNKALWEDILKWEVLRQILH